MSSESNKSEQDRKPELLPGFGQVYRDFGPYLTMGFQLAAAIMLFFLLGWWLDGIWNSSPLCKLLGIFLGAIGGMIKFFKTAAYLEKSSHKE
ncbi:MAG: AtpZ/AtpI family protein [bacterium]